MNKKCWVSSERHKREVAQKQKEVERFQKEIKTFKILKEKQTVTQCLNCISQSNEVKKKKHNSSHS